MPAAEKQVTHASKERDDWRETPPSGNSGVVGGEGGKLPTLQLANSGCGAVQRRGWGFARRAVREARGSGRTAVVPKTSGEVIAGGSRSGKGKHRQPHPNYCHAVGVVRRRKAEKWGASGCVPKKTHVDHGCMPTTSTT